MSFMFAMRSSSPELQVSFYNFKRNRVIREVRDRQQEVVALDLLNLTEADLKIMSERYSSLRSIDIQDNICGNLVVKLLQLYPELEQFSCGYKDDPKYLISSLGKLKNLHRLGLRNSNTADKSLKDYPQIITLKNLSFEYCGMSCVGVRQLIKFPHLLSLNLNNNPVSTEGVQTICNYFPELEELSLWGANVTNRGAIAISRLYKLSHLNLGMTKISNLGCLKLVHNLQKIKYLKLWSVPVTNRCARNSKYISKADRCIIEPCAIDQKIR